MNKIIGILAIVLWSVILLGCAGFQQAAKDQEKRRSNLREIGDAYRAYWFLNLDRGPKKAADLEPLLTTPEAKAALTDGTIVVNYGIPAKEMLAMGAPHTVLAYERDVPTGSGFVLTAHEVKHMTAGTFGNMAKPRQEDLD